MMLWHGRKERGQCPCLVSFLPESKSVSMTVRVHPFPFRTRKLSSSVATILVWRRTGKIARCQHKKGQPLLRLLFFALAVVLSRSSPDKAKMRRCRILERRFRRVDMEKIFIPSGPAQPSDRGDRRRKKRLNRRLNAPGDPSGEMNSMAEYSVNISKHPPHYKHGAFKKRLNGGSIAGIK